MMAAATDFLPMIIEATTIKSSPQKLKRQTVSIWNGQPSPMVAKLNPANIVILFAQMKTSNVAQKWWQHVPGKEIQPYDCAGAI